MHCETGKLWTQCLIFPEANSYIGRENISDVRHLLVGEGGGGGSFFVCVVFSFFFPLEDCFALNLLSFRIVCSRLQLKLGFFFLMPST